ncbi:MAG: MotA/TolQ/ExbB proton channel family protein [Vicinamibacterales bacterium]
MHTLGPLVLALQVPDEAVPLAGSGDIIGLVAQTGPVNQAVLVVLLLFSVVSWAVVLQKAWAFRLSERDTRLFLDVFRRSSKFSEVQAVCASVKASPLTGVFQAGYAELNAQLRQGSTAQAEAAARPTLKSLTAVDRALLRASAAELGRLEQRVTFLATTASITPFIGLFGTVWGIMVAFQRIGVTGSTNLAVVAPGISEALIATATGLFAAIPAVYFYNYFTSRVKVFATEMDDFSLEFLNIAERNFT